uniref:Uncharacterized protein n=1 Tax=Trypanosoma congolense (strain IL3000) TaxID=1068625 RepID=G0US42_TRYCI|nr:conserved hypothetical protein [Trypanosoma congolense IL3000]
MAEGRYHLHIVDGGDRSSTVTASMIFAHLTLRCGQLRNYLLLSASSTGAKRARDPASAARLAPPLGTSAVMGEAEIDDQLLLAAESLLRGEGLSHTGIRDEEAWDNILSSVKDRIVPYKCFGRSFAESEASIAVSTAPYFDFIATADVASFDYLLDYYMGPRLGSSQGRESVGWEWLEQPGRPRKRIGIIHILCGDPVRAGYMLQRFMELLLEKETKSETTLKDQGDRDAWVNRVDHVVLQMYQLLSVDVLFFVV